ncbi:uncharacterized protein LOC111047886 isoform X2 [Nilaparvata lugens]|uniref:uncharacterized protein LOC111047886 isoform X2 n=1 Tax=Nilaparvata lugens TaxID=108931 RepID=UPI00193E2740|nr:uncharacterized protein LOC111047886 isoform X2 [Nilaparvata lugens]
MLTMSLSGVSVVYFVVVNILLVSAENIESSEELDDIGITLEMARKLSNINSIEDYYKAFNIPHKSEPPASFSIFSDAPVIRGAVAPGCRPVLTSVEMNDKESLTEWRVPNCIEIERCSRCSPNQLYSCQPNRTETLYFEVAVMALQGRNKPPKEKRIEVVPVERHLDCQLSCRVKKHDCISKLVRYDEDACKCVCKNSTAREKCLIRKDIKSWDSKNCTCQCKNITNCHPNDYFNNVNCSCEPINTRGIRVDLASNNRNRNDYNYYSVGTK